MARVKMKHPAREVSPYPLKKEGKFTPHIINNTSCLTPIKAWIIQHCHAPLPVDGFSSAFAWLVLWQCWLNRRTTIKRVNTSDIHWKKERKISPNLLLQLCWKCCQEKDYVCRWKMLLYCSWENYLVSEKQIGGKWIKVKRFILEVVKMKRLNRKSTTWHFNQNICFWWIPNIP